MPRHPVHAERVLAPDRPAVTDSFALLNEPRRPWLDLDALQARFLALSSRVHPDRVHNASREEQSAANDEFAQFNAAYNCLRELKSRLRHLLELEKGEKLEGLQRVTNQGSEIYFKAGLLCRQVDAFLKEKAHTTSPLHKVQIFQRAQEWIDQIQAFKSTLSLRHRELEARIEELNTAWENAPAPGTPNRAEQLPLRDLEEIFREISYAERWIGQMQERWVELSV